MEKDATLPLADRFCALDREVARLRDEKALYGALVATRYRNLLDYPLPAVASPVPTPVPRSRVLREALACTPFSERSRIAHLFEIEDCVVRLASYAGTGLGSWGGAMAFTACRDRLRALRKAHPEAVDAVLLELHPEGATIVETAREIDARFAQACERAQALETARIDLEHESWLAAGGRV